MIDFEPKPCCVNLRCKSMYYSDGERPGLLHDEEAMGYWCNKTTDSLGPDEILASHRNCQEGRGCFARCARSEASVHKQEERDH